MPEAIRGTTAIPVTDWLPATARPVREGVYERLFPAGPYSCWNGRAWNVDADQPASAASQDGLSPYQRVGWRGLTTQTGEPCATCRGHTLVDRGFDAESGADLIGECPDC